MRILAVILMLGILTGCASTQAVNKNYDELVHGDAVNAKQARIIAQHQLITTEEKDSYRLSHPDIKTGPLADKYPGDWFVVFGHNWLEPMSSDALETTYTELRQTQYLVVINKQSGKVLFFGEWYPKRENDFDWVFDLHAYNRKDPLALPPYKHSRQIF